MSLIVPRLFNVPCLMARGVDVSLFAVAAYYFFLRRSFLIVGVMGCSNISFGVSVNSCVFMAVLAWDCYCFSSSRGATGVPLETLLWYFGLFYNFSGEASSESTDKRVYFLV